LHRSFQELSLVERRRDNGDLHNWILWKRNSLKGKDHLIHSQQILS
jgi:hypothetical protein